MYKLKLSRKEKKELALSKWLLVTAAVIGLAAVVWVAWVRPAQKAANVNTFEECRAAGNQIQESYPEVCLTQDGRRFVNPVQDKSHKASLEGAQDLTPPTNPELLYLELKEWKVRVPLTNKTFDLTYSYLEDGLNDRMKFTYKRLVNAEICAGDVGLVLYRQPSQHQPPFTAENPAPLAQVGVYYYYPIYAKDSCYDTANAEHTALVKQITGEQSLTQATAALLAKLQPMPEE